MALFSTLPPWATLLVLGLFIVWAIRLWLNHRQAVKESGPVDYIPNADLPWAWPAPVADSALVLEQEETCSRLDLAPVRSSNEVVLTLLGVFLAGLGIWIALNSLFTAPERLGMCVVAMVCLAGFGWMLAHADTPVVAMERTPDQLVLTVRVAVWLKRRTVYKADRARGLRFSGKLQGVLEMNTDQLDRFPDFYLFAYRKWLPSRRFLLRCHPRDAEWIVTGLNQWVEQQQPEV